MKISCYENFMKICITIGKVAYLTCLCISVHDRESCKNGWTDRDVVWGVDSPGPK